MKKLASLLLSLMIIVAMVPLSTIPSMAAEITATKRYITYSVSNGEATITDVDRSISGDITIPSKVYGYPVTNIGIYAFSDCSSLTSVTIPNSVTRIGDGAFKYCSRLTSIYADADNQAYSSNDGVLFNKDKTEIVCCPAGKSGEYVMPNSVTSICDYAFSGCSSLTYNEYDNAKYLGNSKNPYLVLVEATSTSIISCDIYNETRFIYTSAFYDCSNLTSIIIPDSVTNIGRGAFSFCSSIRSVTIPNSVTSIGYGAFFDCISLKSITIPDSVISIGSFAFDYCISLNKVNITDISKWYGINFGNSSSNPLSNGADLYLNGNKVTDLEIPDGITSIGNYAFCGCNSLTTVAIPNSVISIGYEAFSGCRSLTSITIPNSVTSIGYGAFSSCSSLEDIIIPDSVTSIGNSAFSDCNSLRSITIPFVGSKKYDTSNSYFGCIFGASSYSYNSSCVPKSLKKVKISGGTSIDEKAFYGCDSLTSLTIPYGVISIGNHAFYGCSNLSTITIPSSVISIGNHAFYGCNSLTDVYYSGSEEQWDSTTIGYYNDPINNATINCVIDVSCYEYINCNIKCPQILSDI